MLCPPLDRVNPFLTASAAAARQTDALSGGGGVLAGQLPGPVLSRDALMSKQQANLTAEVARQQRQSAR